MFYNRRKFLQFAFSIYISLLLIVSIIPSGGSFNEDRFFFLQFELRLDYILHFCAFFGFFVLLWLLTVLKTPVTISDFRKLFFVAVLLSTGTEIIQSFLPYRTFNPLDLLSNLSGVLLGAIFFRLHQIFISNKLIKKKIKHNNV